MYIPWSEPAYSKCAGTIRILEFRRAHSFFSHHPRNARQRDLQLFRIGREREEKSALRHARCCRFRGQYYLQDRRLRRIGFQMQQPQFQQ